MALAFFCTAVVFCFVELFGTRMRAGRFLVWRLIIDCLICAVFWSAGLAVTGASSVGSAVSILLLVAVRVGSRIKVALLGEPVVFSDIVAGLNLLKAPQFYVFALPGYLKLGFLLALPVGAALLIRAVNLVLRPHLEGLAVFLLSVAALTLIPEEKLAPVPDLRADIVRMGMPATLFLYWRRWLGQADMAPPGDGKHGDADHGQRPSTEIVVVVQCESFADPTRLPIPAVDRAMRLPGLERARRDADFQGDLLVSGFGAYTMRTEYGLLFGRSEEELGFRRYDPFLTAMRDRAYALPYRLSRAGYRTFFVHPHALSFYRRDRLMPWIGFSQVAGREAFPHVASPAMPYPEDRAVAAYLSHLVEKATEPSFFYAVTMENHGPWPGRSARESLASYLGHLANSDRMLDELRTALDKTGRSYLLVFVGDHRPSIRGMLSPGEERGTPYVVLRSGGDCRRAQPCEQALTPAELHRLILDLVMGRMA